jgi:hypothetical protein
LTYSQFMGKVQAGQIASVIVVSDNSSAAPAICRLRDGHEIRTVLPPDYRDAIAAMQANRVDIEIRDAAASPRGLIRSSAPFLLLLGVWFVLLIFRWPNGPRLTGASTTRRRT